MHQRPYSFITAIAFALGAIILLSWPSVSFAYPGFHGNHHYFRYHDHPHFGYHVHGFYPDEYYSFWLGNQMYWYDDGIYYNYAGPDYVIAAPPVGAVVSTIPSDFIPIVIDGKTYYTENGTYYMHTPQGYKVVNPPTNHAFQEIQDIFKLNIPNDKGGYTSISIKRSGNGFVGPQGEFYLKFPSVAQLKVMYGK